MNKIDEDEVNYWKRASEKDLVRSLKSVETIEGTVTVGEDFRGGEVLSIVEHPKSDMLMCVIRTGNTFFEHDLERRESDDESGNDGMTEIYLD